MHRTLPAMTFTFSHILTVHCHKFSLMKLFLVHQLSISTASSSQRTKVSPPKLFPVCSLLPSILSSIFNNPLCTLKTAISRCLLCDFARPDLRCQREVKSPPPPGAVQFPGNEHPILPDVMPGKFTYMLSLTLKGSISL